MNVNVGDIVVDKKGRRGKIILLDRLDSVGYVAGVRYFNGEKKLELVGHLCKSFTSDYREDD